MVVKACMSLGKAEPCNTIAQINLLLHWASVFDYLAPTPRRSA